MIKGLFEAHLPVSNLEKAKEFYKSLNLELAWEDEDTAFFWIEKEKSWLGLWEGEEVETPYHPSLRHIAFRVDYEFMKDSLNWLEERNINAVPFGKRTSVEPFVRPNQGNASVYFQDPDGNSLEFMCFVDVPPVLKGRQEKFLVEEWEELLR
ncbi:extradiol dioxygenase [Sutcliffiella cohnii]|uniref:Extradiol dioxygenase n=1 Tax=Sutcliffiella cohnii TaxID=33932 RepID=A0A223KW34_9BACI|nr:VOC family protein [Sutcliffiella cohnii]AST93676.1 extradiol dioxygenase [Sutcliffiella cohnii]